MAWGPTIMRPVIISIICLALRLQAVADFSGFPLVDATNLTWESVKAEYNPIGQIYSGVVERCSISGVSEPSIVKVYSSFAGTSNEIVTNAFGTFTNINIVYTNITTTNQIDPWVYDAGGINYTGYPTIDRAFIHGLDTKIYALLSSGSWVSTNEVSGDGTYSNWFETDDSGGSFPSAFPIESRAGLFHRQDIGYSTNLTTNAWGFVTGGDAWFTRTPAVTSDWVLAESHYTGSWVFVDIGSFERRYYDTEYHPVLKYTTGGTNAIGSYTVSVTGQVLNIPAQTLSVTSETVTVTSTNTALTNYWFDITAIASASPGANTGDVMAVIWTNEVVLYGSMPYELFADDIDERVDVLSALLWTYKTPSWDPPANSNNYWSGSAVSNSWADATLGVTNDWAGAVEDSPPTAWTFGNRGGFIWQASGDAIKADALVSGLYTSAWHSAHLYLLGEAALGGISSEAFDDNGSGIKSNLYVDVNSDVEDSVSSNVFRFGQVTVPVFPPEPANGETLILGYRIGGQYTLLKWDGTNGMFYK